VADGRVYGDNKTLLMLSVTLLKLFRSEEAVKDRPCIQRMIVNVRHSTCFKDVLPIDLSFEVNSYCNELRSKDDLFTVCSILKLLKNLDIRLVQT
jgi:hypothetical protein